MTIYGKVSIVLILGGVVVVVAATTRHLTSGKEAVARPEARAGGTDAQLKRMQADLSRLELAVQNQRLQAQTSSSRTGERHATEGTAAHQVEDPRPRSLEERKAAEHERIKRREQSLVTAMRLQQRDEIWASETEQAIQSRVDELDPEEFKTTAIRSVSCRQSICEARISHESMKEARGIAEAMARIPSIGSLFSMREDGPVAGSYETAIFFGKSGQRLPQ